MKFSRITWLILGTGILAIAAAGLYIVYQDQADEQDSLNQSLLAAEATLPELVSETNDLENELAQLEDDLAQAQSQLDEVEGKFPDSIESSDYGDLLFYLAQNLGLEVTSFTSSEPSAITEDGLSYEATYFTVAVEGDVDAILQYLTKIQLESEFWTATIDEVNIVNIDIVEPADEEEEETSADISLRILSFRGI